ncbi:uncharacterized protein BO88DRAFT_475584 [Aspergillus vadensis CBS 113365]|uniref:Aminoglycoside phosphotransferase domain-containing protein n=1 Tax=Aspergillus vadensis (strain CBS 113365 / IMI 142717 / IBT 24658) TaxID=1448311 RepID=A0A319BCJ5_ASPVC|nr:hypothetical protein BO88DRAFT_475584 [Aspergillus vadensis CBS 113365]PYH63733.1 hypothetical protein BO88DRAFT_475584 [Aspergillus vadensis CBS 113365]
MYSYNGRIRSEERKRIFNVPKLKRLVASSKRQKQEDVIGYTKLAEGGFNMTFLITMRDKFKFPALISYPVTQPREVATVEYLRSHGIPVPEVYGNSASADNPSGTEHISMELVRGRSLGDAWFNLSPEQRTKLITEIVGIKSRLFALRLQSYSDDVSESLQEPTLPSNLNELGSEEQDRQANSFQRHQPHYHYVFISRLRHLFHYASNPWDGDNLPLKSNLFEWSRNIAHPCTLVYSQYELKQCPRLTSAQGVEEQMKMCQKFIGVGSEGWVPSDQIEEMIKVREQALKKAALEAGESEDRRAMVEES